MSRAEFTGLIDFWSEISTKARRSLNGRRVCVLFIIALTLSLPTRTSAQWKPVLSAIGVTTDMGQFFESVYFLDDLGRPDIGFVGAMQYILKTTDAGATWREMNPGFDDFVDFTFKDTLTGWAAGSTGCWKTTDGGITWRYLDPPPNNLKGEFYCTAVYFNSKSHGLFLSTMGGSVLHVGYFTFVSWDEGATWVPNIPLYQPTWSYGYAFSDQDSGVMSVSSQWAGGWWRTTDGGHLWSQQRVFDLREYWQLLAIRGSNTYFGCSDQGQFIRSDDGGISWRTVYNFPVAQRYLNLSQHGHGAENGPNSSCVRGDINNLFVVDYDGCYYSMDTGRTWRFLGGMPTDGMEAGERFWVSGCKIFIPTIRWDMTGAAWDTANVWVLDLNYLDGANVQFGVTSGASVRGGDTVQLDAGLSQLVPGYDTVSFRVRYDTTSSELVQLHTASDWLLVDSSRSDGYLRLRFRKADSSAGGHIAKIFFRTFVSSNESAKFVIDSVHFAGAATRAGCATLALGGGDSVTISIQGCGETTLRQFMSDSLLFRIVSVQPNPAQSEIAVTLSKSSPAVGIRYQIENQLGVTVREDVFRGAPIGIGNLADGCYYLRMSCGGFHQSRKIVVQK